jgi:hypothetical protein
MGTTYIDFPGPDSSAALRGWNKKITERSMRRKIFDAVRKFWSEITPLTLG